MGSQIAVTHHHAKLIIINSITIIILVLYIGLLQPNRPSKKNSKPNGGSNGKNNNNNRNDQATEGMQHTQNIFFHHLMVHLEITCQSTLNTVVSFLGAWLLRYHP